MSGPRLVVERLPEAGGACRIVGEELAHANARRLAPGDAVVLIDGSGREALGRVSGRGARELRVDVESVSEAREPLPPLTLAVAAVRAERLAWVAEKATEFGVARLVIVASERTQRFRAGEGAASRLERVVREAAKQSERARWPEIVGPLDLGEFLRTETADARLILDSRGEPFPSALSRASASLLVGPEGGWSESDWTAALAAGWIAASLAAGILRAETAAVAALALARAAQVRGATFSN